jgi:hypothetical protein
VEAVRTIEHQPTGAPPRVPVPLAMQCFFDRYQPAWVLRRPRDWQRYLTELAQATARQPMPDGRSRVIEFWNEPYLNWATKPGVNYDGSYYEYESAAAGEPMTVRGQRTPVPGLVWDRQVPVALHPEINDVYYLATRFGKPLTPGEPCLFRGEKYRVEMRWWGRDTSQATWWGGAANRRFYEQMVSVFAPALKAANPEVPLVVGWGFHLNQDGWAAWEQLHRPLIDLAHPWIDGYNEHHYGGDTRMVVGTYETAYAYTLGRHGKRLRFYNTEAGGMLDPERPDSSKPHAQGRQGDLGEFIYTVRDIIHLLAASPDKAGSRFAHEMNPGDGAATAFTMLRPLRGELLFSESTDDGIDSVASRNGKQLCVVLFNDHRVEKALDLHIVPPPGQQLTAVELIEVEDAPLGLRSRALPSEPDALSCSVVIPGKRPVVVRADLSGQPQTAPPVRIDQYVSGKVLQTVKPGESVEYKIDLPADLLAHATAARLRIIQDTGAGELHCHLADHLLTLRPSRRWLHDEPVEPALLSPRTSLRFSCPPGATTGYRLCAVSLLLIRDPGADE